jgi:hypothetical protein
VLFRSDTNRRWSKDDCGLVVSKGDLIHFKTTTPAWATNPDGVRGAAVFVLEYE